jgi:hypothetical protein
MGLDIAYYNGRFITAYPPVTLPDPKYEVRLARYQGGTMVFRCIGVHHLLSAENNGNHNIFLDVLDKNGERINGAEIAWGWEGMRDDEIPRPAIVDKPANEAGTNISLVWGQKAFVSVKAGHSDMVSNLHIMHPDESPGNTLGHHSFYVVFLLTDEIDPAPPEPTEKIVTTPVQPSGRIEWTILPDGSIDVAKSRYKT